MFSRVNAKAGVSRFPPPRPIEGAGPGTAGAGTRRACLPKPRAAQEVERHLALPARPLLSLRASVSPLAVGENLLQGGPLPPIDGEAILGSHEHDLAGEPASILSR